MLITLEETKKYLRVDSSDDDMVISQMMETAETLVLEVGRLADGETDKEDVIKTAQLYATAYLYEHREEADHKALIDTLRYLLIPVRKEVF